MQSVFKSQNNNLAAEPAGSAWELPSKHGFRGVFEYSDSTGMIKQYKTLDWVGHEEGVNNEHPSSLHWLSQHFLRFHKNLLVNMGHLQCAEFQIFFLTRFWPLTVAVSAV